MNSIGFSLVSALRDPPTTLKYAAALAVGTGTFESESLTLDGEEVFRLSSHSQEIQLARRSSDHSSTKVLDNRSRSQLKQLWGNQQWAFEGIEDVVRSFGAQLSDLQMLRPVPEVLRDYSAAALTKRMGDDCEDFAALINTILRDDAAHSPYTSWLKELTPNELDDVIVLQGAKNDLLFGVKKDGVEYPATVLSDGTLRFAAIAAAFFQPEPPKLLLLEEIEDGLHATRLQLLVELLKSQTGRGVQQVIATTHSPYTIAWLREEDYRHVFLFTKDEETGATKITPFSEVPHLIEVARRHPISDMLVEGWMETAV